MLEKFYKFWAYVLFIFLQSQSYVTMFNMLMNLIAVIIASKTINDYVLNLSLPYYVSICLILIFAVLFTFLLGLFQYYFIFKHQYTATVNQAKEMKLSYERIENIEKMLKEHINEKN